MRAQTDLTEELAKELRISTDLARAFRVWQNKASVFWRAETDLAEQWRLFCADFHGVR